MGYIRVYIMVYVVDFYRINVGKHDGNPMEETTWVQLRGPGVCGNKTPQQKGIY